MVVKGPDLVAIERAVATTKRRLLHGFKLFVIRLRQELF